MKKYLLGLFVMFVCVLTVNASSNGPQEIMLEGINLISKDSVAYNGTLEVSYELSPKDVDNKNLTWSVSEVEGLTAIFADSIKTNSSTGTVRITFNNKNDEAVKVTITAKDSTNKITKSIDVTIQDEQQTTNLESKAEKIENLINSLDNKVTRENYSKIDKTLGEIDTLFNENENVEDFVDDKLITKYGDIMDQFENFKESSLTTGTIVTIVILGLSFIFGLFVIFKKEEK